MSHTKFTALIMTTLALSGCGFAQLQREKSAFMSQMAEERQLCLQGHQTACEAYRIDVSQCSIFAVNGPCRANP